MKKAFTLIELLIVIGILGILMGVILSQFGGATESSRAAVCQSHMRNLAQACQTYAMANNYYPRAGTQEFVDYDSEKDQMVYGIRVGWIARLGDKNNIGRVDTGRKSGTYQSGMTMSEDQIVEVITNGCLYATLGKDRASYTCPHEKGAGWSYAMNCDFGFTPPGESEATGSKNPGSLYYGSIGRADRKLLFAEIDRANASDAANDPILDYDSEHIGFNHKNGKLTVAHIVYADCHTARLACPKDASNSKLRELTEWLCQGYDVTYVGGQYEKVEDSATED